MNYRKNILDLVRMSPEHTKLLNKIAEKEKKKYIDLIDKFSLKYGKSRFWWATTLASRNVFLERSFYSFCIVKLVYELLKNNNFNEIIVPLYSIKKCLENNLPDIKIVWMGDEKNFKKKRFLFKIECLKIFCKTMRFRKSFLKQKFIKGKLAGTNLILVDTYDVIGEISGKEYHDRYFSGLSDNTEEKILYFSYIYCDNRSDEEKMIDIIKNQNDRIIYESYFEWIDILEILKYWRFCSRVVFNDAVIDGIDFKWILDGELKYGESSINSFMGLLKSKAIFRFIKKSGANIKGIIGWYEGQPSSNTLFYEMRKKTNLPIIAYVLSPLYDFNLGLSPSKIQMKMGGTAEYFGIQGEIWEEQINEYTEEVKIIRSPSFRFQSLFKKSLPKKEGDEILVVLSSLYGVSREMILAVDGLKISEKKIKIKNHPINASKQIEDYGIEKKDLSSEYEFVTGNMDEALKSASVAIVSETTAAMEILIHGIKVIVWSRPGKLRQSCVPNKILEKGLIKIVYTVDELKESIDEIYNLKLDENVLLKIRDDSFTEVSEETVKNLLKVFNNNC